MLTQQAETARSARDSEAPLGQLNVFNNVSLDGYFTDAKGDMSWAHQAAQDPEWNEFSARNASGESILIFGRVTYDMMAGFWPTAIAAERMPALADYMNRARKVVFSTTLKRTEWNGAELRSGDVAAAIADLKTPDGPNLTVLGSGTLVAQLAALRVVDRYDFAVHPIALGAGRTLFEGLSTPARVRLAGSRAFGNGVVVNTYLAG